VPTRHRPHRLAPLLLLSAVLAGCDQMNRELPTGARAGEAGMAPLLNAGPDAVPGRYIVVLHDGEAASAPRVANDAVAAHGGTVHHTYRAVLPGFAASLSPRALEALRRNPRVKYVAEDGLAYPGQTTQPGATWGLDRIDQRALPLNGSYSYGPNGTGVRVYVIDSGIRTTHNEFGGRASVGTDFVGDGQNGQDCNGHGTHVAGTIAGATYGVAKNAQVIAVRVFPCSGGTATSTVIAAADWVRLNAVKPAVVNYSGGSTYNVAHNQAVQALIASGVTYVTSAGNESIDACERSPASTPQAITVAATQSNDARSTFSNWGACVDLFAPGTDITSAWYTTNTAAATIDGTSMASPHVAGVAALYLQGSPTAAPATVAAAILGAATPGRVTDGGMGTPNRLLYSPLTAAPVGAVISLIPGSLNFTFVRSVEGAAAATDAPAVRQSFTAGGSGEPRSAPARVDGAYQATATSTVLTSRVNLSNVGNAGLEWYAHSSQPWLSADPAQGQLNPGYNTFVNATVNAAGLAAGTHTGAVAVVGPGSANVQVNLPVTVNVSEALALRLGTPRTGQAGAAESLRYYAVTVPAGAPSLSISVSGGTGDADLYVRYGNVPTLAEYDCGPYLNGNLESCHVTAPAPGTYYVMLHGYLSYSGVTLSATLGGPPAAPLNLATRVVSVSAIQLTWQDASVNEGGFYVQRRSHTYPGDWTEWAAVGGSAANATSFANQGLTAGTRYQYRVRTCNAAGCSAWVDGEIVTMPTSPPSPPFDLVATPTGATAVALTWMDGSGDETLFYLARGLRNPDGSWAPYATIATLGPNTTSFNDTGLLSGRQYRYQVTACNPRGCSAWASSGVTAMPSLPGVPRAISGTVLSASSIRVQWTDGSAAETSFQLERTPVAAGFEGGWVPVAAVPAVAGVYGTVLYTQTGLSIGTHRYRVRSCNLAGCSAWITSGDVVIPEVPGVPGAFRGTALSPTSIRLMWDDPGTETSIQVHRALQNPDGSWPAYASVATLGANVLSFDNTGLLSSRVYRYQARGCNVSGCSAWAVGIPITTPNP
jgi:subtilisin family serine protease